MIIQFDTPLQANEVIKNGLRWYDQLCECSLIFSLEFEKALCGECQARGHLKNHCAVASRCMRCSSVAEHLGRSCTRDIEKVVAQHHGEFLKREGTIDGRAQNRHDKRLFRVPGMIWPTVHSSFSKHNIFAPPSLVGAPEPIALEWTIEESKNDSRMVNVEMTMTQTKNKLVKPHILSQNIPLAAGMAFYVNMSVSAPAKKGSGGQLPSIGTLTIHDRNQSSTDMQRSPLSAQLSSNSPKQSPATFRTRTNPSNSVDSRFEDKDLSDELQVSPATANEPSLIRPPTRQPDGSLPTSERLPKHDSQRNIEDENGWNDTQKLAQPFSNPKDQTAGKEFTQATNNNCDDKSTHVLVVVPVAEPLVATKKSDHDEPVSTKDRDFWSKWRTLGEHPESYTFSAPKLAFSSSAPGKDHLIVSRQSETPASSTSSEKTKSLALETKAARLYRSNSRGIEEHWFWGHFSCPKC